jgi:hypothetical protein
MSLTLQSWSSKAIEVYVTIVGDLRNGELSVIRSMVVAVDQLPFTKIVVHAVDVGDPARPYVSAWTAFGPCQRQGAPTALNIRSKSTFQK